MEDQHFAIANILKLINFVDRVVAKKNTLMYFSIKFNLKNFKKLIKSFIAKH